MSNIRMKNFIKYQIINLILFLLIPLAANAAILFLEPSEEKYGYGDTFAIDIYIDVREECVNTIEGFISFTIDYLLIDDFLIGDSLINIWVEQPNDDDIEIANQTGVLHFSGGIPGGYCGRIPGDPGRSNKVGRVIFKIPSMIVSDTKKSKLEINFLEQSKVLLNDGLGTEDTLITKGAIINLLSLPTKAGNKWREELVQDRVSPEPFTLELQRRDDIYEGKYYIIFHTIDKQSGIDYYEVLEIRPSEQVGVEPELTFLDKLLGKKKEIPDWKRAQIPYLLQDQTLQSIIQVRAVDKAGNERVVEYLPPASLQQKSDEEASSVVYFMLLLIVVVVFIILIIIIKIIKTRKNAREE
ncbi:hypothetical protein ACFLZ9_00200 [Patescibacteria group bacterium]